MLLACLALLNSCQNLEPVQIVITIPSNPYIRSIDSNYYKLWLEEETGFSITFNIIPENYTAQHIETMFDSGYIKSDGFFLLPKAATS